METPYYVDPAVLKPGAVVSDIFDSQHTRLVVLRTEPTVIVRRPDGEEAALLAHLVQLEPDQTIPFRPIEEGTQ